MNVLLIEIPSADHAFEGWLGGKAIREIFNLLDIESAYKLILSRKFLIKALDDISEFDVIHIECHSDEEGICYNPTRRDSIKWETLKTIISKKNDLTGKHLVISGCLAGNIDSKAKYLAKGKDGFKRVFAFAEEIAFDKAVAVWSGFYFMLSEAKGWKSRNIRPAIRKLRDCYHVKLLYFYRSRRAQGGIGSFPS